MSEADYRAKMQQWKKSRHVIEGMELIDVMLADMDREKQQAEEMKKAAVQGRLSLRDRLKYLVTIILTQTSVREKIQ